MTRFLSLIGALVAGVCGAPSMPSPPPSCWHARLEGGSVVCRIEDRREGLVDCDDRDGPICVREGVLAPFRWAPPAPGTRLTLRQQNVVFQNPEPIGRFSAGSGCALWGHAVAWYVGADANGSRVLLRLISPGEDYAYGGMMFSHAYGGMMFPLTTSREEIARAERARDEAARAARCPAGTLFLLDGLQYQRAQEISARYAGWDAALAEQKRQRQEEQRATAALVQRLLNGGG